MKKVRNNIFETNSSSVHTISISKTGMEKPKLTVKRRKKEDGTYGKYIIGSLGTFDKNTATYISQDDKLSYLLTICFLTDGYDNLDDMMDSYEFKELEEEICKYCEKYFKCDGIKIDKRTLNEAYIDHQTLCDYSSLSDFKYRYMDYVDFVFNSYVGLETTCD